MRAYIWHVQAPPTINVETKVPHRHTVVESQNVVIPEVVIDLVVG